MKLNMISEHEDRWARQRIPPPTGEMIDFFEWRTKEHIDRVARYLKVLYDNTDLGDELIERANAHDDSKYGPHERLPYIWLTEFHRRKNLGEPFEYPPGVEEKVRKASYHHITNNRHHPEFHQSPKDMTDIDVAEMVADWSAMADELGEGSPKGWADKNVGSRWEFTDDQVNLIYDLINVIDERS